MRLLILGALGPYPERMTAFSDDGHRLWHLSAEWLPETARTVPWEAAERFAADTSTQERARLAREWIARHNVDAVYSLLNTWDGSNAVTAALLRAGSPVPVVRHYKEQYLRADEDERVCLEQSRGVVLLNEESRQFFAGMYRLPERVICLDGDPLPVRYHAGELRPKLSAADGRAHLLIAGTATDDGGRYDYRELVRTLTAAGAHVHLYGQFRRLQASGQMANVPEVADEYRQVGAEARLHIHAPVRPEEFVTAWSPYDAGLLHNPATDDPFRAFNLPNRYSAYLAAGLAVAMPAGEMPAMERHLRELGTPPVLYSEAAELVGKLPDAAASARTLAARGEATFEAGYGRLAEFIRGCL